jgi:hypothetical protein
MAEYGRVIRLIAIAAAAAAALAAPATAGAVVDIHPTATVSIKLGGKAHECIGGKCGHFGGRTATVAWASSCNDGDPGLNHQTAVSLWARPKAAGARPVSYQEVNTGEGGEGATGSDVVVVPPGLRLYADVEVSCSYTATDPDGSSVDHTGSTQANTADVFLPPALIGFEFPRSSFCGVSVPKRLETVRAQAGQSSVLDYFLRFSPLSMLAKNTVAGKLSAIRLHGLGAGLNFSRRLSGSALKKGEYQTSIRPRRGGILKIWATIGGVKTNTRAIRVYPKRC